MNERATRKNHAEVTVAFTFFSAYPSACLEAFHAVACSAGLIFGLVMYGESS